MKKAFLAMAIFIICTQITFAGKMTDPFEILPDNADLVIEANLSKLPIGNALMRIPDMQFINEESKKLLSKARIVASVKFDNDPQGIAAIQMSKSVYKKIMLNDKQSLNRFAPNIYYHCTLNECVTYLDGYAYSSSSELGMKKLLKNYVSGARSSIKNNKKFIALDKNDQKDAFLSVKILDTDFEKALKKQLNENEFNVFESLRDIIPETYQLDLTAEHKSLKFNSVARYKDKNPYKMFGFDPEFFKFSPSLHEYIDAKDRFGFVEAKNLSKTLELLTELPNNGMFMEIVGSENSANEFMNSYETAVAGFKPYLHYFSPLKGNYVFAMHTAKNVQDFASFTLLSEIDERSKKADVIAGFNEFTARLNESLKESDSQTVAEVSGLGEYRIRSTMISEGTGEPASYVVYYGINSNNQFYITTDTTRILEKPNANEQLMRYFGTAKQLVSAGKIDFTTLMQAPSLELQKDELKYLDSLMFKERVNGNILQQDLTINFTKTIGELIDEAVGAYSGGM